MCDISLFSITLWASSHSSNLSWGESWLPPAISQHVSLFSPIWEEHCLYFLYWIVITLVLQHGTGSNNKLLTSERLLTDWPPPWFPNKWNNQYPARARLGAVWHTAVVFVFCLSGLIWRALKSTQSSNEKYAARYFVWQSSPSKAFIVKYWGSCWQGWRAKKFCGEADRAWGHLDILPASCLMTGLTLEMTGRAVIKVRAKMWTKMQNSLDGVRGLVFSFLFMWREDWRDAYKRENARAGCVRSRLKKKCLNQSWCRGKR